MSHWDQCRGCGVLWRLAVLAGHGHGHMGSGETLMEAWARGTDGPSGQLHIMYVSMYACGHEESLVVGA